MPPLSARILRHHTSQPSHSPRTPKRKALLVGINYQGLPEVDDFSELFTPQRDAEAFRQFLLEERGYREEERGYREEDVVLMVDKPDVGDLAPTQQNMQREIRRLVQGACAGDSFVFLYAGHSGQIENKTGTEEDGKDEVLLPLDHKGLHEPGFIMDNDLRKLLVDSLPVGARLIAIFDSCHSGTLLDLDHYQCFDYSNGETKASVSAVRPVPKPSGFGGVYQVIKEHDGMVTQKGSRSVTLQASPRSRQITLQTPPLPIHTLPLPTPVPSQDDVHCESPTRVSRPSASDMHVGSRHASRTTAMKRPSENSVGSRGDITLSPKRPRPLNLDEIKFVRTTSPEPISEGCRGGCPPSPTEKASVFSLAACNDAYVTYEDRLGEVKSLTQVLIEYLRKTPEPPLIDLMEHINGALVHAAQVRRQLIYEAMEKGCDVGTLLELRDEDALPCFGSQKPIVPHERFIV